MAKGRKSGFGIIGCGMISRFHAKAVADIKGAKVVACFDSFTSSADKFGAEIGCKVYHKLEDMLADKSVDVVTIMRASRLNAAELTLPSCSNCWIYV